MYCPKCNQVFPSGMERHVLVRLNGQAIVKEEHDLEPSTPDEFVELVSSLRTQLKASEGECDRQFRLLDEVGAENARLTSELDAENEQLRLWEKFIADGTPPPRGGMSRKFLARVGVCIKELRSENARLTSELDAANARIASAAERVRGLKKPHHPGCVKTRTDTSTGLCICGSQHQIHNAAIEAAAREVERD